MAKKQQPKGRKTTKKVTRRKRKSSPPIRNGLIVEIEQVYKIVNRVQVTREVADFIVREADHFVVDNVLRDARLIFTSEPVEAKGGLACMQYKVEPRKEVEPTEEDLFFDEFPDEIIEDGQIFF